MTPLILASTPDRVPEIPAPRTDFRLLAETLNAPISTPPAPSNTLLARLERRTATDLRQAFAALKRRRAVSVYVSMSEKIGIPLALLLPRNRPNRPAHLLVAHHPGSAHKRLLQTRTNYLLRFDRIVTLSQAQARYLIEEAGVAPSNVVSIRQGIDTQFWTPPPPTNAARPYILSIGVERRDYETLAAALYRLPDVQAVVGASSQWARETEDDTPAAPNLTLSETLSYAALRDLTASATLVVVPLRARTFYAAGANACLEAMALNRPLLASETPGIAEYLRGDDGTPHAALVPPNAPDDLANAIRALLADPAQRELSGTLGSAFVRRDANLEDYVRFLAAQVRDCV